MLLAALLAHVRVAAENSSKLQASASSAALPSQQRSGSTKRVLYKCDSWDGLHLTTEDAEGWLRINEALEGVIAISSAASSSIPPDLR
jgi:hypothetical protein